MTAAIAPRTAPLERARRLLADAEAFVAAHPDSHWRWTLLAGARNEVAAAERALARAEAHARRLDPEQIRRIQAAALAAREAA